MECPLLLHKRCGLSPEIKSSNQDAIAIKECRRLSLPFHLSLSMDIMALHKGRYAMPIVKPCVWIGAFSISRLSTSRGVPITTGYCWRTQDWLQNGPEKHDLESPQSVNSSHWGVRQQYPTVFDTTTRLLSFCRFDPLFLYQNASRYHNPIS